MYIFYCFIFSSYKLRFFVKVLIEMNVDIRNEFNFSDKCKLHWVASKVYVNPFRVWGSFTLHATQCSLQFDKPQKNEIHSLNNFVWQ